jgi:hypothetical protein
MPDITMCKGDGCGLKENCNRYNAKPCHVQVYFSFPPWDSRGCKYYAPIEKSGTDDESDWGNPITP